MTSSSSPPAGKKLFNRVAIAGVGLIGGSLALAGKRAGLFGSVIGLGRGRANLQTALRLGVIDQATSEVAEAASGADLFFVSTPVQTIVPLILQAAPHLPAGSVVTDGGSVKKEIVERLDGKLPGGVSLVGGHPVAGTENTGAAAAFADLYKGRHTVLTPVESTDRAALDRVRLMWESVGSHVSLMAPGDHDQVMAVISHMPHIVAFALMDAVTRCDPDGRMRLFSAGGLRDTTRIAGSDPAMWRDIFSMNRQASLDSLSVFIQSLESLKREVEAGDFAAVQARLERVSQARREMNRNNE